MLCPSPFSILFMYTIIDMECITGKWREKTKWTKKKKEWIEKEWCIATTKTTTLIVFKQFVGSLTPQTKGAVLVTSPTGILNSRFTSSSYRFPFTQWTREVLLSSVRRRRRREALPTSFPGSFVFPQEGVGRRKTLGTRLRLYYPLGAFEVAPFLIKKLSMD